MNKDRRKRIKDAVALLYRAEPLISEARSILEDVKDEEQSAFDNLTEGLQQTERGQAMEQAVQHLEAAVDSLPVDMNEIIQECENAEEL